MNVLIVDSDSVGLDFAIRCQEFGHSVKFFSNHYPDGNRKKYGDGLVEKVSDFMKWARWADLIFATNNTKYLTQLDYLRSLRYPVFAPPLEGAKLEIERGWGMKVLKQHGIDCPPFKTFNTLDEAEKHVWKTEENYVFKTLGSDEDKAMSFVSKNPAELINQIRRWKKQGKKLKGQCMLQTFIKGVEFGVSSWFGPGGFSKWKNECFEHKKLMPKNFGPNTGEMGTAMKYVTKSKLFDDVLKPVEDYLHKIDYRGDIDMNCIIDESGTPWPLEFTCRPGWPAFFIMTADHKEPCEWMVDLLHGKDTLETSGSHAVGVVIAQPNFPYTSAINREAQGVPIYGVNDKNWEHIHPAEMMMGKGVDMVGDSPKEKDMLVTAGEYVMVVTGLGDSVSKASKASYKVVDQISIPNMIVRDDVGEKMKECIPKLQEHGYASEWQY